MDVGEEILDTPILDDVFVDSGAEAVTEDASAVGGAGLLSMKPPPVPPKKRSALDSEESEEEEDSASRSAQPRKVK
eukprot:10611-Alexandrium_andersonii.AAC.1